MKRRLIFLLPVAVFAVIVGFFLWGLQPNRDPRAVPTVMIDKETPEFDYGPVPGLSRPGFSSQDLGQGEVVLVNFFASWCIPCRVEHPLLTALTEDEGIPLYGISHRDRPEAAIAWLERLGNPYQRIGSDAGRGAVEWGVYGLPETFVIDGAGRIRYHHRGPLYENVVEDELIPLIRALRQ
jgi:cytochrome c biogenesis protein CcmG/thiol:disulfide interchange protein DsbE